MQSDGGGANPHQLTAVAVGGDGADDKPDKVTFKLPSEWKDRLEKVCRFRGATKSQLVRDAVQARVIAEEDEMKRTQAISAAAGQPRAVAAAGR